MEEEFITEEDMTSEDKQFFENILRANEQIRERARKIRSIKRMFKIKKY